MSETRPSRRSWRPLSSPCFGRARAWIPFFFGLLAVGRGWLLDGWALAAREAIPVAVGGLKAETREGRGQDYPLTWRTSVTCAASYLPAPESRSIRSLHKRNTDSKSTMATGIARLAEPHGLAQRSLSGDNSIRNNGTLLVGPPLSRSIGLV